MLMEMEIFPNTIETALRDEAPCGSQVRGFVVGLAQQMIGIGFIVANWVRIVTPATIG